MTETLTCERVDQDDLIAQYIAGTLTETTAREAFEDHFVGCARCRDELRLASIIRAEVARPAVTRRVPRWMPLGFVSAAALAGIFVLRGGGAHSELARLGAVAEPPIYLGIAVRATPKASDSLFDAAMAAYDQRRYADAAAGLARALTAGVDSAPALFFLGASELMAGHPTEAAAAFERVQSLGDTPYLAEAHFYRAKALLRLRNPSSALAELAAVPAASTTMSDQAGVLADSVRKLTQR